MRSFQLFNQTSLSEYIKSRHSEIEKFFESKPEQEFLKLDESKVINDLTNKYKLETSLDFDKIDIESEDVGGTDYFIYQIPYTSSNTEYFKFKPDNRLVWTIDVNITGSHLIFDIVDHDNNSELLNRKAKDVIEKIKKQVGNVDNELSYYNDNLERFIHEKYNERKQRIENRNTKLKALKKEFN